MKNNLFLFVFCLVSILLFNVETNAQWQRVYQSDEVNGIRRFMSSDTDTIYAATSEGLIRSINKGSNWSLIGLSGADISDIVAMDTELFISVQDPASGPIGVHKSTNYGLSWDTINTGLPSSPFTYSIVSFQTDLFANLGPNEGFYKTTDEGLLWTVANSGLPPSTFPTAYQLVTNNNRILAATNIGFLIYDGSFWSISNSGLPSTTVRAITVVSNDGMKIFIGTDDGVYLSKDGGSNWEFASDSIPSNNEVYSILSIDSGATLLAGVNSSSSLSGIYRSSDNGLTWQLFGDGFNTNTGFRTASTFAICDTFLLVGISANNPDLKGIWRRPLSQVVLSVDQISNEVPNQFSLGQNYPNPFNPSTTIELQIPATSLVELRVFDLLGKEVATLVNEELNPGNYKTDFDGSKLASGIYFYRLKTGIFMDTKKFILMK